MIKKYIRGNKERCSEVIKELAKLGGINNENFLGEVKDAIYYIDSKNYIKRVYASTEIGMIIMSCFDEIKLPKLKLKVIRGDQKRCDEVIQTLIDLGGINYAWQGADEKSYYFMDKNGKIRCKTIDCDFFNDCELEILELPKKQEHQFKPFDRVLVRDCDDKSWRCDILSNIDNSNKPFIFVCIGENWKQCIPYEGNEDLVGTCNNPITK